ncbi:MAG: hypothetical protein HYV78_02295, partial [Candidatus Wildermuthbacteria bacterium]|nr:hypothetical protein [Candidatus Wildermuthbacteria bacterium]
MLTLFTFNVIKIAALGSFSFLFAFLAAPYLIRFLYAKQLWRKEVREKALGGGEVPYFNKFHKDGETRTPRFGGSLIWMSALALAVVSFALSKTNVWWLSHLNFLSRSQTWLPLGTLLMASAVGFVDDLIQVVRKPEKGIWRHLWGRQQAYIAGGMTLRLRILFMLAIAVVGAWWFYFKLERSSLHIPGIGDFQLGWWYIALFILTMLATYSGGVIDGLDGLSGGTFASMFAAFGLIAFSRAQIDIAALSIIIAGALLAFLWFNIPPAKFYMG